MNTYTADSYSRDGFQLDLSSIAGGKLEPGDANIH